MTGELIVCTGIVIAGLRGPMVDAARAAHRIADEMAALRALAERGRR